MKFRTITQAKYGKARIIARYDKETGKELIDMKVYDGKRHVVLTTQNYGEAHAVLMYGDIVR